MTDSRPLVMHVVYRFNVGGLENGVVNLINRLPESSFRHLVVALTSCDTAFRGRVYANNVEFVSLNKAPGHGLWLYPRLFRLMRERRPAVVHTRNLAALEAVVPAWFANVPLRIHGEHGWDLSDPDGRNAKNRLLRRLYRPFVNRYVALSGQLQAYLQTSIGIPAKRVTRICNGVDTARFQPAADGRETIEGSPFNDSTAIIVGTVGRLQAVKDQSGLVRAFAQLCNDPRAQRLRLLIAGEGPMRGAIETEIAAAGLGDRVWLAGERADVAAVLRGLDLFVLPSRAEGISNTILEAMACGLPVVATDVGGNGELVSDGQTGRLVPAGDRGALAEAIAGYAADPARMRRHGAQGRRRAEEFFSLETMVAQYASLYDPHLGGAGHAGPAIQSP